MSVEGSSSHSIVQEDAADNGANLRRGKRAVATGFPELLSQFTLRQQIAFAPPETLMSLRFLRNSIPHKASIDWRGCCSVSHFSCILRPRKSPKAFNPRE